VPPAALPAKATASLPADTKFVSLRQEVQLGVRQQGKVEITEGLTAGQTVVVAGQQRLQRDGTPLRIVALGQPAALAASAPAVAASAPAPAASR
jgi:membrane fusion protein (multidrug efflux system)